MTDTTVRSCCARWEVLTGAKAEQAQQWCSTIRLLASRRNARAAPVSSAGMARTCALRVVSAPEVVPDDDGKFFLGAIHLQIGAFLESLRLSVTTRFERFVGKALAADILGMDLAKYPRLQGFFRFFQP